jgi:hypothetical protein
MNDHDLLVRLDTKLDRMSDDFKEVKDSVRGKAEIIRVEKIELRLDDTQRKLYMVTGGLVVVEALLRWIGK